MRYLKYQKNYENLNESILTVKLNKNYDLIYNKSEKLFH